MLINFIKTSLIQYLGIAVAGVLSIINLFIPDASKNSRRLKKSALILTVVAIFLAALGQITQNREENEKQNHFRAFGSNVLFEVRRSATKLHNISATVDLEIPGDFRDLAPVKANAIHAFNSLVKKKYILDLSLNQPFPYDSSSNGELSRLLNSARFVLVNINIKNRNSTNLPPTISDVQIPGVLAPVPPRRFLIYDIESNVFDLVWTTECPAITTFQARNITSIEDLGEAKIDLSIGVNPNGVALINASKLHTLALWFDNDPVMPTMRRTNSIPGFIISYAGVFPPVEAILNFRAWAEGSDK